MNTLFDSFHDELEKIATKKATKELFRKLVGPRASMPPRPSVFARTSPPVLSTSPSYNIGRSAELRAPSGKTTQQLLGGAERADDFYQRALRMSTPAAARRYSSLLARRSGAADARGANVLRAARDPQMSFFKA